MRKVTPAIEQCRINYAKRNCPTKILEPEEVIKTAIKTHNDKVSVSCSFGSCSVVVLHMALKINPQIKVVFNDTGVEYPETYAYRTLLRKEWNLNLIETKPNKSFWQCVKEFGFPLMRTQSDGKIAKPKCCIHLKELPMAKACSEHNIEASLTGLRCSESSVRMFTIGQRGQYYHTEKWGSLWRYHPIAFWTHKQVHGYLQDNDIPINQVYKKGLERCGCMPCTSFTDWEAQLSKGNLKMYRIVQRMRKVDLLDNYIERENLQAEGCLGAVEE